MKLEGGGWTLVDNQNNIAPVARGKKFGNPTEVKNFAKKNSIEDVIIEGKTTSSRLQTNQPRRSYKTVLREIRSKDIRRLELLKTRLRGREASQLLNETRTCRG